MKYLSPIVSPLTLFPIGALGALIFLASCAETRLVMHTAKKISSGSEPSTGTYKVGEPYQVDGVWYHPHVNYAYRETGIASWYGPKFHRRRTANGEIFDMHGISAAHRTLPLPSMVRVTNLQNGRSLKVVVNDRGPFAHGRIIDLSRRAAQLLGFERAGVARVEVEVLPEESRRLAGLAPTFEPAVQPTARAPIEPVVQPQRQIAAPKPPARPRMVVAAPPQAPVKVASLDPRDGIDLTVVPVKPKTSLFVQAGAFISMDLARKLERNLATIGPTQIVEATVGDRLFYRVRLGPVATVDDGDRMLDAVMRTGYPDARLVVY